VTVDSLDNIWTQGGSCIYKIAASGNVDCYKNTAGRAILMQADKGGNVYILTRNPNDAYYKVTPDGSMTRVAGMLKDEEKKLRAQSLSLPIDGPAMESTFRMHGTFVVSKDGILYGGGGDEYALRRVKNGHTMTLFKDGWRTAQKNLQQAWKLGGPIYYDINNRIYVKTSNASLQPGLRRIVPIP
jgi:hypothetical protein